MGNDSIHSRYRWIMLFLLWLLYIAFGLVARSITPLITPILNDLRMTYSQMGFILGSWQLTYILVALMAGAILDRWGVRKSICSSQRTDSPDHGAFRVCSQPWFLQLAAEDI